MNSIQHVDELFRGFANSYKAFEADCRTDKDKGFQAEKIIEDLFASIASMDLSGLLDYWRYLDIRYFSRLDHRFAGSVKKFELCLLRYYLVYAIQHKKREKVVEFFEVHGAELQGNPEWVRWFALPFSKKPEADPEYDVFFSKTWLDTFTVSLNNFLSTVFQNMPLPSLLCFNIDRLHRKALQCEVETLQSMVETLRKEVQTNDAEISLLKDQVALKKVTGARRRRAASMVEPHLAGANANGDPKSDPVPKRSGSQSSQISQTSRLAITNARRLRAASDAASLAKSEERSEASVSSLSDDELARVEEPFIIASQELFLEHQSGITHAKFSCEGSLISSCDAENIVRIWSYNGSSAMPPAKITNTNNILSLAWETRDRYLFLGTDANLIRCFSLESRSIVHEIKTDAQFPRVRYLAYSPVEPILICAVASGDDASGALLSINMKSMTTSHTVLLTDGPGGVIDAIGFNHNGQMIVTGDVNGMIRIYEIRSLTRIMEWSASSQAILSCTFSFDETCIYSVDAQGQVSQDSVHKPDHRIDTYPLQGFKSSTLSSAMIMATSSSNSTRSAGSSSVRSRPFVRPQSASGLIGSTNIPRIQLEGSGSGSSTAAIEVVGGGQDEGTSASVTTTTTTTTTTTGSSSSTQQSSQPSQGIKGVSAKDTGALTAMNVGPGQLLGWSGDTEHLVMGCGNAGVIVQVNQLEEKVQHLENASVFDGHHSHAPASFIKY
ncbi:WD repeat-containing protein 91 [Mortierella sp. GBA43]|nr:WD repeat-containing protein 91 [Mortierella sp. GBA43]